jgi:hypothetical protein
MSRLMPMLIDTASLCGAILLIIGAATAMAWALTQSGFSRDLAAAMTGLPGGAATFMIVSIVALWCSARCSKAFRRSCCSGRCCFRSRARSASRSALRDGGDPRDGHRLFAPPFGVGYYAACAIGRVDPDEGMRPIWPYLLALLIGPSGGRRGAVDLDRIPVTVARFRRRHMRRSRMPHCTC